VAVGELATVVRVDLPHFEGRLGGDVKEAVDGHKMRSGSRPVTGSDAPSSAVASVDTAELVALADLCRGLREGSLIRRRI
jgi:hypothetical protein